MNALISAGVDPNISSRKGVTPISAASHKGNTKIMNALIDAGAAVNALNTSGSTALIQVIIFQECLIDVFLLFALIFEQ